MHSVSLAGTERSVHARPKRLPEQDRSSTLKVVKEGDRIRVFWTEHKQWFAGRVGGSWMEVGRRVHQVHYSLDNQTHVHALGSNEVRWGHLAEDAESDYVESDDDGISSASIASSMIHVESPVHTPAPSSRGKKRSSSTTAPGAAPTPSSSRKQQRQHAAPPAAAEAPSKRRRSAVVASQSSPDRAKKRRRTQIAPETPDTPG